MACLGAAATLTVALTTPVAAQDEPVDDGECSSLVWAEDFGAGPGDVDISTTQGSTPMRWNGPEPKRIGNGEYTITSNLTERHGGWWFPTSEDHTPDDSNGRMMVLDVADQPQEVYRATVGGLTPGQTYCVSGWLANANRNGNGGVPNVSFNIFDGSERIAGSGTGDLPNAESLVWRETSFTFVAPVEEVVLSLYDNVGERSGVDFVIDDLTITTNGLATLTVLSVMVNDEPTPGTASADDFTVTVTAEDDSSLSGPGGAADLTEVETAAGLYTIRQSGPDGYGVDLSCEGATVTGDQVVVYRPAPRSMCTFTNDDVDADRDGYADEASVDPDPDQHLCARSVPRPRRPTSERDQQRLRRRRHHQPRRGHGTTPTATACRTSSTPTPTATASPTPSRGRPTPTASVCPTTSTTTPTATG